MAAKTHPILTTFSAGEWSPVLSGRVDLAKYQNACETLENFVGLPHGGVVGRPGTHFVAEVKDSASATRLIPFRFSVTQAYLFEVGNAYLRVYRDHGRIEVTGTPIEIVTPWNATEIWELQAAQYADTVLFVHPDHAPRKLVRYSHTDWRLSVVDFSALPTYEYGTRTDTYVVPGATTGTDVQFDAGGDIFLDSDVGRELVSGAGRATIVTVDSASRVHADITSAFASTAQIAAGDWYIAWSPQSKCQVYSSIYTAQTAPVGTSVSVVNFDGTPIFRSGDVGKYIRIYGGTLEITAFVSASNVTATIMTEISGAPNSFGYMGAIVAGNWSLEEAAWSASLGYPRAVGWFEGRLLFAGTDTQPRTWWMSRPDDPFDFLIGSNDDDGMEWTLDSAEINVIQWLAQSQKLLLGTAGAEYSATGGTDAAITPTNTPLVRPLADHGSGTVPAIKAAGNVIFLSASGKQLIELAYRYDADTYLSPDLLLLAEHLTHEDLSFWLTALAVQKEPHTTLWAVRSDGTLLGCTYLREESVVGWHRHVTAGAFESVAVIPHPDLLYDEVWVTVARTIGGSTKRYIEYFDMEWDVYAGKAPGIHTDSCLTYSGSPVASVSGLGHLEGKTVAILGDGSVYPSAVVTAGAVALDGPTASKVEVGLSYTCTLTTMRPEVQIGGGTSQGLPKSWSNLNVRFRKTMGATVNGETIPWRSASDAMDDPPPLFTGDKQVTPLGWDNDGRVTVTQTQPLPITILAIFGNLMVGE